jgi:hypothetical protein
VFASFVGYHWPKVKIFAVYALPIAELIEQPVKD